MKKFTQKSMIMPNGLYGNGGGTGGNGSVDPIIESLTITENGTYEAPSGVDGYSPISVNVASSAGGGGNEILDALIDGSITELSNNTVTAVKKHIFKDCTTLKTVNLPSVDQVYDYAFQNCPNLTSVDMPLVTSIGNYAFEECTDLTSVDMPLLKSIGNYTFYNCTNLTSVDSPLVTNIGTNAFQNCTNLRSVDMPLLKSIGKYAFQNCASLTSVDFPLVTSISNNAFQRCASLTSVDFPLLTSIGNYAFLECTNLTKLILRSETICVPTNINSFNNTPFASGGTGGTVYVPSALITEYQNATNWSTLYAAGTCNFVAIEGSEYE